jgi:hypothetical protein
MKFTIPTQRIYLFDEDNVKFTGGSVSIPSRPRIAGGEVCFQPIVGGVTCLDTSSSTSKLFVIVDSLGKPLTYGNPPKQKTYEACSQGQAAVKAFYAWWRSTKQGILAGDGTTMNSMELPMELNQRLNDMEDVTKEEKINFIKSWLSVNPEQLEKRILIRVSHAGGTGSVKSYNVGYEMNEKPNKLEVKKRIVVTAKAIPLRVDSERPANIVDLESVLNQI